ncbi:putative RING finger host range protein [Betaentomopoxvirus amoorei]|uniref:AMV027 n=1 Tax=Amsacta moorei entomopoxvirus TaxID=28321 RepID=Q9EN21_AMEPV|nr:putative RING finger host range protein [Amsacta moorei entomopoxvirus]AAG02733.1 AMV027 [Amsacta moorei entomopoxvirus]
MNFINDNFYFINIKNLKVIIDNRNNYFNITKLLNSINVDYNFWYRLNSTKILFNKICKNYNTIKYIITGNNDISGVYIHPIILIDIINWINNNKKEIDYFY